ncbi:hypothetical protein J7F03_02820 [Streptomyces sp. ISL-43]|uniref:hypothetical protein n=1 Tax=Streptomyces sp. ISL-43 TaxID=2819183 RepID=UPI001BE7E054|nr:hypothetical protein [Streptomyces sp. ISL-43]MBT2446037.1 hypothetical protein [Streptomyces sp. ISL-43]
MHDVLACRHIDPAACPDASALSQPTDIPFDLVGDASAHEVSTTASRHLRQARDFLPAVRFMVAAGYHSDAGPSTVRLAEVFAARMRRSKHGHFPFSIETAQLELGLGRRTVLKHARVLRELGLIAYIEHGSKTNSMRTRHGDAWTPEHGYRGTATLFAAVAPPVWDAAMGRRTDGTGYRARVIGVTCRGRTLAVADVRRRTASKPNRGRRCTPSSVVPQDHRNLQVVEGKNYTRARGCAVKSPKPTRQSSSRLTPAQCAQAISLAEQLQREVWWLHRSCARRLAHALRPLILQGWSWQGLAAELQTWGVPGYLRDPSAFVRYELARQQRLGRLGDPTAPTVRDELVDDTGQRYTDLLNGLAAYRAPVINRFKAEVGPQLRQRLAEIREAAARTRQIPAPYAPPAWLREPEDAFLSSLPPHEAYGHQHSPWEVYEARAEGHALPQDRQFHPDDEQWLTHLKDQLDAERACAALRADLETWQAEQEEQPYWR